MGQLSRLSCAGGWCLIYRDDLLGLVRTGAHAGLFEKQSVLIPLCECRRRPLRRDEMNDDGSDNARPNGENPAMSAIRPSPACD